VPRHPLGATAVAILLGAAPLGAQSCDLFVAALAVVGADSGNAILVDRTVIGVPGFAFNAYSGIRRGDTAVARVLAPRLDSLNHERRPIPSCLTAERHWRTASDSTLLTLFRGPNGWDAFHQRFGQGTLFALISRPLVVGDTATLIVAVASGKLSGMGVMLQYVRGADGRWVKRAEAQLWVS